MRPVLIGTRGMNGMRTFSLSLLAAVALLAVPAGCNGTQETASTETVAGSGGGPVLARTVVMAGLDNPWDLAFAPDGAMLFTEKCRGLSVRRVDGTVARLFGTGGSAVVAADFFCRGQSGMNGVAVDPDLARTRLLYVFMASNLSRPETNRVVRLKVDQGYTTVSDRTDIVSDIPFKNQRNRWGGAGAHSGGRLSFSPADGLLHVTTGDNHEGPLPQDVTRPGGKVLRIDRAGRAAPGNIVPSGGDPRIFTYGHRNIQGIAFRPGTGQPFSCEHGPGHSDEVTPLVAGGNGGWDPKPEPGVDCASNYCGYISNRPDGTPTPMTDLVRFPGAMRPSWNNRGESEGLCPCVFLRGPAWKAWDGRLATGFLRGRRMEIVQLDGAGVAIGTTVVSGLPSERIRALVQGPDGALYVATDGGEIWRLAPRR